MVSGLRRRHAFFHELALAFHDLLADVQDRLLPLVQALDQKFSGADLFADVILHLEELFRPATSGPCRCC